MKGNSMYDIVVVGAGPAGISAARTAARLGFSTLVVERLAAPGDLSHPCSAMIAPLPHAVTERLGSELYFRKIDLSIPASLIVGLPTRQRWVSPTGHEFSTSLGGRKDMPAAVIDKSGLLRMLAKQASAAGAEMRFGTEVIGLLRDGDRITGVRTDEGEIRARMVLSAEGMTRALSSQVLPPQRATKSQRYGLLTSMDLDAPAVGVEQVGQLITLGHRYTSAREAFGMALAPRPGRLSVFFCMFADRPRNYTERSARFYIQEYMTADPRIRALCTGARPVSEHMAHVLIGEPTAHIVANGFMGVGDSVTPTGYLGILPSIYMGRQAALFAVEAVDSGDTSAEHLGRYEQIYRRQVLPELKAEYLGLAELSRMSDDELDILCQSLRSARPALPFSAHARSIEWATVGCQMGVTHQSGHARSDHGAHQGIIGFPAHAIV